MSSTSNTLLESYAQHHMNVLEHLCVCLTTVKVPMCGMWMVRNILIFCWHRSQQCGIQSSSMGSSCKSQQAGRIAHTSNYFATVPQIELSEKLPELADAPAGSRVYFANSGTEGNEAALKLIKLHANARGHADNAQFLRSHIVSMVELGALSVTWKPVIQNHIIHFFLMLNLWKLAIKKPCKPHSRQVPLRALLWSLFRAKLACYL